MCSVKEETDEEAGVLSQERRVIKKQLLVYNKSLSLFVSPAL